MFINDICVNILYNISEIMGHNEGTNLNGTISVMDGFEPPLLFNYITSTGPLCGPIAKIVEQVSKIMGVR